MAGQKNDIENLVSRAADSLERNVLPHVESHYARLQLRAVRELLLNLGTRVEWRQEHIDAGAAELRHALDLLGAGGIPRARGGPDTADDVASLASLRAELAGVIEGVYRDDRPEPRRSEALATIWRVIRSDFDAEAKRIRTGMYT